MTELFNYIADLAELTTELPAESILSRHVYGDDDIKVTMFGFAPGQELSEHTAAKPAVLHFLEGEAELVLGDETREARAGTWVHMAANLSHSIMARTSVLMLLILLPGSE